jgi:PBP1b-binding outer membrane lipoprotein LpoB
MKRLMTTAAVAALLLASCTKSGPPPYNTELPVKLIMAEVVNPTALELWKNAGTVDAADGTTKDLAPTTDEGWTRAEGLSSTIAEAANSLMLPGRIRHIKKGDTDWIMFAQALSKQALRSRDAAIARNGDRMFETGADLYQACVNCHTKYLLPFLDKNGRRYLVWQLTQA